MSNGGGANQTGAGAQPGAGAGAGYPFQSASPSQPPQPGGMMGGSMGNARPAQNPFGQQQIGNLQQVAMQQAPQAGNLMGMQGGGQQPGGLMGLQMPARPGMGGYSSGQAPIGPSQMGQGQFGQAQFAPPQNPPFAQQSRGLMGFGRGNDSTLVHMSPNEVGGLQQLARSAGGSLTTNPHTGLPEAGFLESMLPMIAGAALTATGVGAPVAAGMVAAEEGIRNKDWKKGLMAGIGAYGGAGIGGALGTAGAGAAAAEGAGATSNLALGAGDVSALGAKAAGTAAASNAAAGGVGGLGLTSADVSALGSNASKTAINSQMAAGSSPTTSESFSNMGRGIGSLDNSKSMAAFGHQIGKKGVMEAAAPALYAGMNPDPIKTPGEAPTEYWRPGKGYNSLYNPTTHGWNPGEFSQTFGMAGGGAVDPNARAMAQYQAMMTAPSAPAAAPPSSADFDKYLGQMAHNNTTYTPPSVAAPVAGQLQPMGMGPQGNPHFPPGSDFFGMDFNKLTDPSGAGGSGGYQGGNYGGGYYGNPYATHGGRRAGGGLISLMGGGPVHGPGDGVSDSVEATVDGHQPARLAKGEFVVPARIVSELGNGSSDAGAKRLYAMMHRVEAARRKVDMAGDSGSYGNLPA